MTDCLNCNVSDGLRMGISHSIAYSSKIQWGGQNFNVFSSGNQSAVWFFNGNESIFITGDDFLTNFSVCDMGVFKICNF